MQTITPRNLIVATLVYALLGAGCAKQPTPAAIDPVPETPPPATMAAPASPAPAAAAVEEPPADLQAADLQRIHFAFDQFALSPSARATLAANAVLLQTHPDLKVGIDGHCDERGSDEYNLALGERRAKAARDYLVSLGVPAERLQTISYGEEMPLDPSGSEEAWAKNRRAEFKILQ